MGKLIGDRPLTGSERSARWFAKDPIRRREQANLNARKAYAADPDRFKAYHRKYAYKLTDAQSVEATRRAKGDLCDACGGFAKLQVDHDHRTGAYRGMLCGSCNSIAGYANDSLEKLAAVAAYLNRSKK